MQNGNLPSETRNVFMIIFVYIVNIHIYFHVIHFHYRLVSIKHVIISVESPFFHFYILVYSS